MTRGERVIAFIEHFLKVPEGKDVGKPIKLRQWQIDIILHIYDSKPLPRTAIISFGRKNGKTALIAMLILAHIVGPEARQNSQVFSCAQSRDQASIVYALAIKMIRMDERLMALCKIVESQKILKGRDSGVEYKALSSDHSTAFGLSPVLVIYDELGQVKGPISPLYEAMETAMGAQVNPLSIIISTQAATDQDLLSILIDDAIASEDPSIALFLHKTDIDDDIWDEEVWKKANPALGDFRSIEDVRLLAERAQRMPSRESSFRNLIMNQRVSALDLLLSHTLWKANGGSPDFSLLDDGRPLYAGLDLSSRQDLTAFVVTCQDDDENWHVFPHFWTPKATMEDRAERDRTPYPLWVKQGHMSASPGSSIDYDYVATQIRDMYAHRNLAAIAFDRWKINEFRLALNHAAWYPTLVEHGQGYKDMSPSIDYLEHQFLESKVRHGNHPVMTYCAANCVVEMDAAENRKVNKAKATGRIDGMVGLIMAMSAQDKRPETVDISAMIG